MLGNMAFHSCRKKGFWRPSWWVRRAVQDEGGMPQEEPPATSTLKEMVKQMTKAWTVRTVFLGFGGNKG